MISSHLTPWYTLVSHEIVFATFYRKHLWSVHFVETQHDARNDTTMYFVRDYDMHWHQSDPRYTAEGVGSCAYTDLSQVRPFHPSAAYGLPASYWVKDSFSVTPYEGSTQMTELPSWVHDLFFLQESGIKL